MYEVESESAAKSKGRKSRDRGLANGSGMTRRTAIKLSAAAGAVTVLTSRK